MMLLAKFASIRTTIALIVLTAIMGVGLYAIGIAIDGRKARLAQVKVEINRTQDQLDILEADWAYLSRPDRILYLGTSLLGLAPLTPQQIITSDELHQLWQTTSPVVFHPPPQGASDRVPFQTIPTEALP